MRDCFDAKTPGLQWAWDSTSLGLFKTCPRKYQLEFLEGWQRKSANIHLRFGMEFHEFIKEFEVYRIEHSYEMALTCALDNLMRRILDYPSDMDCALSEGTAQRKTKAMLIRTCVWYVEEHKNDPARTLILNGGRAAVEVSFNFDLDDYIICGHLDRIVEYNNAVFVRDYKTTGRGLSEYFWHGWDNDNQMTLYTIAGHIVLHSPIGGVMIDGINITKPTADAQSVPEFATRITHRSPDKQNEWLEETRYWLGQAKGCAEASFWPQNDTACDKYGGCAFRGICTKSPTVRAAYLAGDFDQLPEEQRWNPLTTRTTSITPSSIAEPGLVTIE